jgi:phosphotransferase system HPr (HPr) family protein
VNSCNVNIPNRLGLHARAAAKFVHVATRFKSQIRVAREHRVIDGKSIMGILLLAAPCGASITISADGPDEHEAVAELCKLVESGFGEQMWNA